MNFLKTLSARQLLVAGLCAAAIGWVFLMGLVGFAGDKLRQAVAGQAPSRVGDYHKDGTIHAEITNVDRQDFHITVTVKVTGPDGKVLGGLTQADLELRENDQPVACSKFTGAGQAPVRVCMVMDYSRSMGGSKIEGAKTAALALLDMLRDDIDSLGLYFFNGALQKSGAFERLAMGPLTPQRRQAARDAIQNTSLAGNTPMLSCMERAIDSLRSGSGRRIMVVLTDGLDTQYKGAQFDAKADQVTQATNELNVPIYMISMVGRMDEAGMKKIADKSKGQYIHAPNPDDLRRIFLTIGQTLQSEYVLEYDSPNDIADGRRRSLEVRVKSGASGTEAFGHYDVAGLIATGAGRRASSASGGERQSAPFATVFLPLALAMACLIGLPYAVWLRPKNGPRD